MSIGLKVCGVTTSEDLNLCVELGVDAVGINLWHGSKRGVDLATAKALLDDSPRRIQRVGVFVEDPGPAIARTASELGLDAIQVHDDRPVAEISKLGLPWIWVVRGTPNLAALELPTPRPIWVLLDAKVPEFGGQGRCTDWDWAADAVRALSPLPVWLAGGIDAENAARARIHVGPAGFDVASGAERAGDPRRKDRSKISAILRVCRQMDALQPGDS